jgi:hypothetical protein
MVTSANTTSFLLRDVQKDLWAKVKTAAYKENLTIRDWILKVITDELKRKTD